ncbi:Alpha/beta hydrolase family [Novymonas esmeraldas]|uniref:Alpha/beta hydrolase family n=1 Tax=Novymonas esmeraldas TaxID=1808958 RepID=A0AAW0F573_9TRYP
MRNTAKETPVTTLSASNLAAAAAASPDRGDGREHRPTARLRLEPSMKTTRLNREEEAELLNTTVVVSNRHAVQSGSGEQRTPSNIHLREDVFVRFPHDNSAPVSPGVPPPLVSAHLDRSALVWSPEGPDEDGDRARCCRLDTRQPETFGASAFDTSAYRPPQRRRDRDGDEGRRLSVQHEQDHDCCPFTALRRSEWTLRHMRGMPRTSPFHWRHLLSSFSVKNAFMFYPPPPTYCFVCDEHGDVQVRSQTGKRAPRLDHERIEHIRRQRRLSRTLPDDLVGGALHGIAPSPLPPRSQTGHEEGGELAEPSFELIFIPCENAVQSYHIHTGSVVFGRKVRMGGPLSILGWTCPIPCSIIRPHRRMSSHVCIFFHCNGEDIGRPSCMRLLTLANALHMTLLVPEYPGYGLCEGSPSEASLKGSMERVVEFLFSTDPSITPSRVLLMGHSIGTGVAVHVAQYIQRVFTELRTSPQIERNAPYACPATHDPAESVDSFDRAVRCPQPHAASAPPPPAAVAAAATTSTADPTAAPDSAAAGPSRGAPSNAPYGTSSSAASSPLQRHRGLPCRHYALGGIILLSPFASVRCVEGWDALRHYGLNVQELERRRLEVLEDTLVAAPGDWAADAREVRHTDGRPPPPMDSLRRPPWIFSVARYISFNRFPSIDVMCELQEKGGYFNHTPLLLLHGAQDVLIPPIHTVAIATKLRQCTKGADAKVYLGILRNEGHNNLHCSHIIRRFYKDVILLPHLRRQQTLRDELEETLGHDVEQQQQQQQQQHQQQQNLGASVGGSGGGAGGGGSSNTAAAPVCDDEAAAAGEGPGERTEATGASDADADADDDTVEPHAAGGCGNAALLPRTSDEESSVSLPPHKEPYLCFLEPAVHDGGAEQSGARSVRIHLLHPPPRSPPHTHGPSDTAAAPVARGSLADPASAPKQDAAVFSTRTAACFRAKSDAILPPPLPPQRDTDEPESDSPPPLPFSLADASQPIRERYSRGCAGHDGGACARPGFASVSPRVGERRCRTRSTTEFEEMLRDALERTQPPHANFAPAATMLHIALFNRLDYYDVGSIAVASVTRYSLDTKQALRQWQRYRRNSVVVRGVIAAVYFVLGSFYIGVAINHAVSSRPSHLQGHLPAGTTAQMFRRDVRVVVWGVLDGFAYLVLGVVRFYHQRLGIGNLSRHFHTPRALFLAYSACCMGAYVLCVAVGIIMALTLALASPHRGGVPWGRWADLPYSPRVCISYLPRWTMVGSACLHIVCVVFLLLKNH